MNLEELTKKLIELDPELTEVSEKMTDAQYAKDKRHAELYLSDSTLGLKLKDMRDAQVVKILDNEGLLAPLYLLRGQYRQLLNTKELFIEASRNIRHIERNENEKQIV